MAHISLDTWNTDKFDSSLETRLSGLSIHVVCPNWILINHLKLNDKYKYAWVFLMIFSLKFGINLRFMHVFLQLCSVLVLLSRYCRLA